MLNPPLSPLQTRDAAEANAVPSDGAWIARPNTRLHGVVGAKFRLALGGDYLTVNGSDVRDAGNGCQALVTVPSIVHERAATTDRALVFAQPPAATASAGFIDAAICSNRA
jgi:hypothetical protein